MDCAPSSQEDTHLRFTDMTDQYDTLSTDVVNVYTHALLLAIMRSWDWDVGSTIWVPCLLIIYQSSCNRDAYSWNHYPSSEILDLGYCIQYPVSRTLASGLGGWRD